MSSMSRGRILLVDDEMDVATSIIQLLNRYQFEVRHAPSVKAALDEVAQDRFDVIVLDWILRDGDGRKVISFARSISPETVIIVHSGYPSSDSECTSADADQFVEKSHHTLALRNAVERGVRECRGRMPLRNIESAAPCEMAPFADLLLEMVRLPERLDGPICIGGATEPMCREVALRMGQLNDNPMPIIAEVDAKAMVPEGSIPQLMGCYEPSNRELPDVRRGLLDLPQKGIVLLRNVDWLPHDCQRLVAEAATSHRIRRQGSVHDISIQWLLVATVELQDTEIGSPTRLDNSLRRVLKDRWISLPSTKYLRDHASELWSRLIDRASDGQLKLGPAVANVFRCMKTFPSLRAAREVLAGLHCRPSSGYLELEDIGVPVLERMIIDEPSTSAATINWDTMFQASKFVYLCRVLSLTGGNVAEASRLSGLGRKAIYDGLRPFEVVPESFRRTP